MMKSTQQMRDWSVYLTVLLCACGDPSSRAVDDFGDPSTAADASTDGNTALDGSSATGGSGNSNGNGNSAGPGTLDSGVAPGKDAGTKPPGKDAGTGSVKDAGTQPPPPPTSSSGCGKTGYPESGTYKLTVSGTERSYIVKLPSGYDNTKPYKLVFAWHYLGGNAATIARGYYGLETLAAGSTIFVAPDGIDAAWPNTGGRDVAFANAMFTKFKGDYCIDEKRVFSVGFSYGAIMSNTVGCAMGGIFRAIAPMSGMGPGGFGGGQCTGQVAAWLYHGSADTTVQFTQGVASRDFWLMRNHCQTTPSAADANGCVTYQGCDPGFPVVWCQNTAAHTQPRFGSQEIWKFFSQF